MLTNIPPQCREVAEEVDALEAIRETLQNWKPGGGFERPSPGGGGFGPPGGSGFDPSTGGGVTTGGSKVRNRLNEISQELRERRRELDECIEDHAADAPTEAERAIEEKRASLERTGRGFGSPEGPVESAGHGGSVRVFERGRIYWHPFPKIGAHEVHGGILEKYLEMGGADRNPETGRRDLKFPVSDETRSADDRCPVSHFEEGSIFWLSGRGGVAVYGAVADEWVRRDGELGRLGYPVADPVERAGGTVSYFEHGCLWVGADGGAVREFVFADRPLLGKQTVVDPESESDLLFRSAIELSVTDVFREHFDLEVPSKPIGLEDEVPLPETVEIEEAIDPAAERAAEQLGENLWDQQLVLHPATDGSAVDVPLAVESSGTTLTFSGDFWRALLRFDLRIAEPDELVEGTPYDVRIRLTDGEQERLFSHAVLAAADPEARRSDVVFTEEEVDVVGLLRVKPARDGTPTVQVDPLAGTARLGGDDESGSLVLGDGTGQDRIRLDGDGGDVHLALKDGSSPESLRETLRELDRRLAALEE